MQHPPFWTLLGVGDLDLAGDSEGKTIAGPIGRFCGNHSPEHHDHPPPNIHSSLSSFSNLILNIYSIIHLPHQILLMNCYCLQNLPDE